MSLTDGITKRFKKTLLETTNRQSKPYINGGKKWKRGAVKHAEYLKRVHPICSSEILIERDSVQVYFAKVMDSGDRTRLYLAAAVITDDDGYLMLDTGVRISDHAISRFMFRNGTTDPRHAFVELSGSVNNALIILKRRAMDNSGVVNRGEEVPVPCINGGMAMVIVNSIVNTKEKSRIGIKYEAIVTTYINESQVREWNTKPRKLSITSFEDL